MLAKLKAAMDLFKKGKRLAHPEPWKNTQAAAGLLVPVIAGLLTLVGGDIDVSTEQVEQGSNFIALIGVGAYGLFNVVVTIITTNKIGVSSKSDTPG